MAEITDDILIQMQEESRKRHGALLPEKPKRPRPKTVNPTKNRRRQDYLEMEVMERILRADANPDPFKFPELLPQPKPEIMSRPIQQELHVPQPGPRSLYRVPELEPAPPKPMARPKAVYTNIPTPYGLATQMLIDQMEEERQQKTG